MFAALQILSVGHYRCMHMYTLNPPGGGGGGGGGRGDVETCICVLIRTASKCYLTYTKLQAYSFTARG